MSRNKSCEVFYIIKKDQYLHWILKWYVKSTTSTCIPLNPDVLMNNKCKNSKKKNNIYIDYLNDMLKGAQLKILCLLVYL